MKMRRRVAILLFIGFIGGAAMACNSSDESSTHSNEVVDMKEVSLFTAIKNNNLTAVKQLLESKVDIEQRNEKGETPLMYAVYQNRNAIAKILMQAGANVNAQDKVLNSPFLYAGAEGNLEIVQEALKYGADFTVFNRYNGSALIPAAEKGHLEVVKLLVNYPNYPIDHVNRLGWTVLMEAIVLSNGGAVHTSIVDELIKGGVNVNIPDADGITPLQHAQKRNYTGMVKLLKAAGAK
ncbi:ankyrin repeat domain-containing protein [Myroides odoratimimus]|uniref:ankyrin repeat domain-containing protein n=1 Tax=Myroides odoratimimus TaxID=76832 RepID=UPI00103AF6A8|nr:ankyrin repeat domain-containing protein [Myroides odoratimimus]MCS7474048.1 ankyrin repeat domain-containing protein [Myroides odoratimimus]MDM1035646.1 ankyrin repeat domain-containing protein [Myroides odoratimimus]MDM1039072.1 ankyrin repeat domain-containing protein [Myroides odoratimimus]MDM1053301.1 ankyrin repeat domain-containing protein [Myroides odoratimimus]MDM1059744.1 ankyrin repeat domain-containing protein [Myroides odoratimimus]